MYEIDELDKVVPLDDIPHPSSSTPEPCILADEHSLQIVYFTPHKDAMVVPPAAIVQFTGCISHSFGMPNDEALSGHPLYERGLKCYGVYKVENSSWIRKLERMNSVHPRHRKESYARYQHLVFTFHDSTFECVCREFTATTKGISEAISGITETLNAWSSKG